MITAISYDIVDDKRRNRISKLLDKFGYRVQKSVFELNLTASELRGLVQKIEAIIDIEEDSVRIYRLNEPSVQASLWLGQERGFAGSRYFLL